MKVKVKIVAALLAVVAGLVAVPVIIYARSNSQLAAERTRVHGLVHVGQRLNDAEAALRLAGYSLYGDAHSGSTQ